MDGEVVVRPGQVWADNDVRCKGRTVRVAEVGPLTAICEILTNSDAHQEYVDGVRSMAGYRPVDMLDVLPLLKQGEDVKEEDRA